MNVLTSLPHICRGGPSMTETGSAYVFDTGGSEQDGWSCRAVPLFIQLEFRVSLPYHHVIIALFRARYGLLPYGKGYFNVRVK